MIVYNLACHQEHHFEGWFTSPEDFDKQLADDQVACPACGSVGVSKKLSAPYVSTKNATKNTLPSGKDKETALAGINLQDLHNKFMEYVVKNTEDVGSKFPEEARKIHYGETENRSIRGEASGEAIQELQDEGIDVYALPTAPAPPDKLN